MPSEGPLCLAAHKYDDWFIGTTNQCKGLHICTIRKENHGAYAHECSLCRILWPTEEFLAANAPTEDTPDAF